MSTAVALRRKTTWPEWLRNATPFALLALACLAIALNANGSSRALVIVLGALAAGLLLLALFLSSRFGLSLGVCMIYLGCIDGVVRLKTGSSTVTLARDALLYAVVAGVLVRQALERRRVDVPPFSGLVLLWVLLVLAQLVNPGNESLSHSLASVRPHLEFVPLFFLGYWLMRSRQRLVWFVLLLAIVGALNGIASFVQSNLTPAQFAAWGPGYEQRVFGIGCVNAATGSCRYTGRLAFFENNTIAKVRPFGLGSDLAFGGLVGMLALPCLLALRASVRRRRSLQIAGLVMLLGVGAAIVTSQSRTAVLGAVIAAFAFLAFTLRVRGRLRAVRVLAVAALVGYVALSVGGATTGNTAFERYSTIAPDKVIGYTYGYRRHSFELIPVYVAQFPLGAGIGSVGPAALSSAAPRTLDAETEPTFLLVELGIPGLLIALLFTGRVLALTSRVRTIRDPDVAVLLAAIAAGLVAIGVLWVVSAVTAAPPLSAFFWFASGTLVYWLSGRREREPYGR